MPTPPHKPHTSPDLFVEHTFIDSATPGIVPSQEMGKIMERVRLQSEFSTGSHQDEREYDDTNVIRIEDPDADVFLPIIRGPLPTPEEEDAAWWEEVVAHAQGKDTAPAWPAHIPPAPFFPEGEEDEEIIGWKFIDGLG